MMRVNYENEDQKDINDNNGAVSCGINNNLLRISKVKRCDGVGKIVTYLILRLAFPIDFLGFLQQKYLRSNTKWQFLKVYFETINCSDL